MKIAQKFIILTFASIMILVFSCEETIPTPDVEESAANTVLGDSTMTNDWQEVTTNDLPQTILDYVLANYPDEEIKETWLTDEGEYMVVLSRYLILIFDANGDFEEEYDHKEHRGDRDPIDLTELPQVVLDYLAANYPNAEIKKAFVNEEGEYIVKLNNRMVVIFDSTGAFLDEFEKERRKRHGKIRDWDRIDASALPQLALDYINTNHPDDTIIVAGQNDEGEYGVILSSEIALIFDENGNFIEAIEKEDREDKDHERDHDDNDDDDDDDDGDNDDDDDDHDDDCQEVAIDQLPQAIIDYLAANYPNDPIDEAYFNEEKDVFIIELESDIEVVFDIDGNFLQERKDD